jgi:2-alkenal reductase
MNRKEGVFLGVILIVALAAGCMGAAAGGVIVYSVLQSQIKAEGSPTPAAAAPAVIQQSPLNIDTVSMETAIIAAVESVGPAVVTVVAKMPDQLSLFGVVSGGESTGSGFIISPEGYIVTNNHVVEGAESIHIILQNGDEQPVALVGSDEFADLAVLKSDLPVPAVAVLGDSDAIRPGESVIAIGSPLGDFMNTVTFGVISATGRNLDTGEGFLMEGLLQTDAAINQGNSGGPLVNLAAEVIGVNTLILRGNGSSVTVEGLGFAIPSNTVRLVADQIIEKGRVSRPYFGIRWQTIFPSLASRYNLPVEWGIFVSDVTPDSPADRAGIQRGDIITSIGGIEINENQPFLNTLFSFSPGQQVSVDLIRDGRSLTIELVLGEAQ